MKIYEITLKNEEPLLIAALRHGRFIEHETRYLPGSTIRGALLTLLKRLGSKLVDDEIQNPTIIFHPAYPLASNGALTRPAHPLMYECKICGRIFTLSLSSFLKDIGDFEVPVECENGHLYTIKNIGGSLIYRDDTGKWKKYRLRHMTLDSIGINRALKTTDIGLLYSYTALAPGHIFKGLIIDPNEKLKPLLEEIGFKLNDTLELKIGRRLSAGFGKVQAKILERDDYVEKRLKDLGKQHGITCLLAKSPVFSLSIDQENGHILSLSESKRLHIGVHIGIKVKNILKTGIAHASGFSLTSNTPKARFEGLDIGSLMILEEPQDLKKLVDVELLGIGPFSISGFNIVEVAYVD